jgi:multiple sugar transport system permease protein
MSNKPRKAFDVSLLAIHLILAIGALFIISPILWMLLTSLKTGAEIVSVPPSIIPRTWTLQNFASVITIQNFPRFIFNSFVISSVSTLSVLLTSILAGYIFAKFRFPLKNFLFGLILATAIVPFEVYMVSVYITIGRLKLFDSYLGIVFPIMIMSFGVFFMRQHSLSLPDELLDAARVDGAAEFWILTNIVVPLSKTPLAALGIFAFSEAWAFFIWPLIIINSKQLYTIELGLMIFQKMFYIEHGPIAAGAIISIIPMLTIFFALRRQFMQGVTLSGMKA